MITELFVKNLDIVFLIYGVSFLLMAIAILVQPRHESVFKLAGIIWLLAGFGITHGLNEWLDMIAIIKGGNLRSFNFIRLTMLAVSFVFLFEFGRRLVGLSGKSFLNKWASFGACAVIFIFTLVSKEDATIWPRYFLGFPGGVLSAWGFTRYYYGNRKALRLFQVRQYFLMASASLCVYSVLGGIIVPKAAFFPAAVINNNSFLNVFGIPVQVFRAVCAAILAWAVFNILGVFKRELISELKNRLRQSVEAKNFTENIIASITDALIVIDVSGKIKLVNAAACRIFGYEEKELLGKPVQELSEENDFFSLEKLKILQEGGFLPNRKIVCLSKHNEKIPMLFSKAIMNNQEGEFAGIVGVGKDLRELSNLQDKLARSEKLAALGKIAGILGHDFKNQLSVMRQAVYFLKMKLAGAGEKVCRQLEILDAQIIESSTAIDNIMMFSVTKRLQYQNFYLKELLSEITESVQIPEGIKKTFLIEENLPEIQADRIQLARVFTNIVINARDAMKEKGELIIKAACSGAFVDISFRDTGCGITEENKKNIFEPFFSSKPAGMGLGLFTCNVIIEAHGGTIEIESKANEGATVKIKLPVKRGGK